MTRIDVKAEYERIGRERDEGMRIEARERRWFAIRTIGWCWLWVVIGGVLMAQGLNINATVGWVYFPKAMARAEAYFNGGLFIGTVGPFVTLIVRWRKAINRGMLD